jgi:hypothetical protein
MDAGDNPEEAAQFVEELEPGDRIHASFIEKLYHEQGYDTGDVVIDEAATVTEHSDDVTTVIKFDETVISGSDDKKTQHVFLATTTPPEIRCYYPDSGKQSIVGLALLESIEKIGGDE